jgi:hypothetical protein
MAITRKAVDAQLAAYGNTVYLTKIPRVLPEGRVLVHNHIIPQRELGMNGFRAWTRQLDDTLEPCHCAWAGVNLHGKPHYRVAAVWAKFDEKPAPAEGPVDPDTKTPGL